MPWAYGWRRVKLYVVSKGLKEELCSRESRGFCCTLYTFELKSVSSRTESGCVARVHTNGCIGLNIVASSFPPIILCSKFLFPCFKIMAEGIAACFKVGGFHGVHLVRYARRRQLEMGGGSQTEDPGNAPKNAPTRQRAEH